MLIAAIPILATVTPKPVTKDATSKRITHLRYAGQSWIQPEKLVGDKRFELLSQRSAKGDARRSGHPSGGPYRHVRTDINGG
jgi:hypothetical protein